MEMTAESTDVVQGDLMTGAFTVPQRMARRARKIMTGPEGDYYYTRPGEGKCPEVGMLAVRGERISEWRYQYKVSQAELASHIDKSFKQQTLSTLVTGAYCSKALALGIIRAMTELLLERYHEQ